MICCENLPQWKKKKQLVVLQFETIEYFHAERVKGGLNFIKGTTKLTDGGWSVLGWAITAQKHSTKNEEISFLFICLAEPLAKL
jgi:hypothetical protein